MCCQGFEGTRCEGWAALWGGRYGGYDESIKAAVRVRGGSSGDDDFVVPRWARAEEPLPTVSEQVAAGLRRGRSHRDAPLLQP